MNDFLKSIIKSMCFICVIKYIVILILSYYCSPKFNSFIIVNLSSIFSDKSKMLLCNCYWIVENPGLKIIFVHLMYLT